MNPETSQKGVHKINYISILAQDIPHVNSGLYYIWCLYLFKILHLFFYYEFNLLFQILPAAKPNRSTLL